MRMLIRAESRMRSGLYAEGSREGASPTVRRAAGVA